MVEYLIEDGGRPPRYSRNTQVNRKPYQEQRERGAHLRQKGEGGSYAHQQLQRGPKPPYREQHIEHKPEPIGNMCNPVCPLFRCAKKALMVKLVDGKPIAFCTWVNDTCISYRCQYASCFQRYLLPDGKCTAAIRSHGSKEDAFIKELEELKDDKSLKNLLSRKKFGRDLLY